MAFGSANGGTKLLNRSAVSPSPAAARAPASFIDGSGTDETCRFRRSPTTGTSSSSSGDKRYLNESATPTAPKGTIVALNLDARRTKSVVFGQNSLYASSCPA